MDIESYSRIDKAIEVAAQTHSGQNDLGGYPYILHSIRVLVKVESIIRNSGIKDKESVLCSSVLHDCIEDTKTPEATAVLIEYLFGSTVLKTVDSLTRRKQESWKTYIDRVNMHWAPRIIKIADLEDNLDETRLTEITDKDRNRNKMYYKALQKLENTQFINRGRHYV